LTSIAQPEHRRGRRLYTIMERVLRRSASTRRIRATKKITIDAKYVKERLADVLKDEDLSKFIW